MTSSAFLNPRIGFAIGEDYAFYRLSLPASVTPAESAVAQGYAVGKNRAATRQPADRFVRKWLQLRLGAWRRNREVAPDVTPEYLFDLDMPRCPVSQVTLTHATGQDTDWSIDRLCNDGAYAPGNVAVLSTRINKLKGNLSADCIARTYAAGRCVPGMSFYETERLAGLVAGISRDHNLLVRRRVLPQDRPPGVPVCFSIGIQDTTLLTIGQSAKERELRWASIAQSCLPPARPAVKALRDAICAYVREHRSPAQLERLWDDDRCWQAFRAFWTATEYGDYSAAEGVVQKVLDVVIPERKGWADRVGVGTSGYAQA